MLEIANIAALLLKKEVVAFVQAFPGIKKFAV
jgi:hypothetical protein